MIPCFHQTLLVREVLRQVRAQVQGLVLVLVLVLVPVPVLVPQLQQVQAQVQDRALAPSPEQARVGVTMQPLVPLRPRRRLQRSRPDGHATNGVLADGMAACARCYCRCMDVGLGCVVQRATVPFARP